MKPCSRRVLAAVCSAAMVLSVQTVRTAAAAAGERPAVRIVPGASIPEGGLAGLLQRLRDECFRPPVCEEPGGPDIVPPDLSPGAPEAPPQDGDAAPESPADAQYAREVVRLVNERRAEAGLGAVSVSGGAAQAAQARARELETRFSHTRPDGAGFFTALADADAVYSYAGENIAYGQRTPERVMEDWMNSSGHRANILNADFTGIGVGLYTGADGTYYWAQLFVG